MKITICASLDFSHEIGQIAEQLKSLGHEVLLPATAEEIIEGGITLEEIKAAKESGKIVDRAIKNNAIKGHYKKILIADAVLILNYDKKGVAGYIGGNTFLEVGFAYVNDKPIYVWQDLPQISYRDELDAMQPIIINKDLSKIK
jgi:hypothetical protein